MGNAPIQPDATRTPGEHPVLSNYPKRRYICACQFQHEWFAEFDQSPDTRAVRNRETGKTEIYPRRCPGGRPWILDKTWTDPHYTPPSKRAPVTSGLSHDNWDGYPKIGTEGNS